MEPDGGAKAYDGEDHANDNDGGDVEVGADDCFGVVVGVAR